ncbi:MAG: MFS transporter [Alphaproteobacteria bacterium]
MGTPRSVDIDDFIDNLKFGPFHFLVLGLCALLMMIDGYELYVVGWVLPNIADDFHATRLQLTPILVGQQIGMVAGAYLVTPLADKLGRPKVLLIAFAGIAASCFASIFMPNITDLVISRTIGGFFASSVVPILLSSVSENAPKRLRATFSTVMVTGQLGGAIIGALMQAFLLVQYGWRSAFWVGALMPVLMLPLIWLFLPDSLRFVYSKNSNDARIPGLIKRMQGRGAEEIVLTAPTAAAEEKKAAQLATGFVRGLFGEGRAWRTIFLWLAFMSSFTYISAGNWKTTIFRDILNMPMQQIALATALGTGFGILGNIGIGVAIDRWGFRRVLPTAFFIAAVSIVIMGALASHLVLFFVFLVIMNIFQHGGQAGLAALASNLYPAHQRATGVGWAYGAGRIASIFAPILGAMALGAHLDTVGFFLLFAIPLTTAGVFVLLSTSATPEPIKRVAPAHA